MATYLVLNCIFMSVVLGILHAHGLLRCNSIILKVLLILLVTTAIFDSLIIHYQIVAYNEQHILGARVGLAPVEDFFYAALAVIIIPSVWHALQGSKNEQA